MSVTWLVSHVLMCPYVSMALVWSENHRLTAVLSSALEVKR